MSRKKIILCIVLVILILCSIFVVYMGVFYKSNNSDTNLIGDKRLRELYDNSYKYYLLYEGDISKLSDGSGVTMDNKTYTGIKGINSFDDINKLIDNTFVSVYRENYYTELVDNREFLGIGDKLYYNNSNVVFCDTVITKFDDIKVTSVNDDMVTIHIGNMMISAYYENGDWYLSVPLFECNPDIGEE